MPTNVTPEYRKAEAAFRQATAVDEKVERLQDMISLLPKHKGTDHLFADLKRRMADLRKHQATASRKSSGGSSLDLSRDGAAQLALVGPPNSGKSSILDATTHAAPQVADYPFTTNQMQPGMAPYEDIHLQLVDCPPVTADFMPMHLLGLARSADAVLLVADLSADTILDDMDAVFDAFAARHLSFVRTRGARDRDSAHTLILANKVDSESAPVRLDLLREAYGEALGIHPLSCTASGNVGELPGMLFAWLGIVRVYTKVPGRKADMDRPYTVFAGQTVGDICHLVHRDFIDKLQNARLWRGDAFPITVSRGEPVRDGDVVELHMQWNLK